MSTTHSLRARAEAVWRWLRIAAFSFGHIALAGVLLHGAGWPSKTGLAAGLVGVSETLYRLIFPQGSRRVSGWIIKVLSWVQKYSAEALPVATAFDPGDAKTIATVEAHVASYAEQVQADLKPAAAAAADPGAPPAGTQPARPGIEITPGGVVVPTVAQAQAEVAQARTDVAAAEAAAGPAPAGPGVAAAGTPGV